MQLSTIFLFLCAPFYFVLNKYIDQKTKLFIVPVILFYLPLSFILLGLLTYSGKASNFLSYLLAIIDCIAIVILISLIKIQDNLNNVDKSFLYFWLYFTLISFIFGDSWISVIYKLVTLIIFISGLNCGKFIVQNRLEQKAFNYLSLSGLLCAYLYWKILLPDIKTGLFFRFGFEGNELFNPNVAALLCLPFIASGLLSTFIIPNKISFKVVSFCSLIANFYLLFMTGSRNAFFALVTCVVVLISFRNIRESLKFIIFTALLTAIFIAIINYLSTFMDSRIMQLFNITGGIELSGRDAIWNYYIDKMDFVNYFSGSGGAIEFYTGQWSNMHSMYVQIFYESGIIGSILFLMFVSKFIFRSFEIGKSAIIAISIFAMVLASGAGESYPLRGFSIITFMWGMSVGLLSVSTDVLTTNDDIKA